MAPPVLSLRGIDLSFGGQPLLSDAEMFVSAGDRLALVGRNGSGKSTLLRMAAGLLEPGRGERFVQPGTTIRYLPQEPDLEGHETLLDYVTDGLGPGDDPHQAAYLLEQLGLEPAREPVNLSGGETRRAAIARALAPDPDILLLDEPTNHLDLPAIHWLEENLARRPCALVLISHDRRFLETLSKATLWIDRGDLRRLEKGFAFFEEWRDETLEQEALDHHKLERKIHRENRWIIHGVTARRKRNQGRLRWLEDLRRQHRDHIKPTGNVRMEAEQAAPTGKLVMEAKGISKSYGDRPMARDFSMRLQRGERLGLMGPNGTGKTTLLRLLTGQLEPDAGTVRLGPTVEMVTLDQTRESLDPGQTLTQALTGGSGDMVTVNGKPKHVIGYMKDFLFTPNQAGTPITELSGGERGRLMLARALARPSNLLVLDEPGNDLDLETLDLLQEMLGDYEGTVLLVSHDRDFLDRVATSVLSNEGPAKWVRYAGGYSDMMAQKGEVEEAGKPAAKPAKEKSKRSKPTSQKLSFNQKHALETLPGRMEAQEEKLKTIRSALEDKDLFAKDPDGFQKKAQELEAAQAELAQMEEDWLAAEMMREELEG